MTEEPKKTSSDVGKMIFALSSMSKKKKKKV